MQFFSPAFRDIRQLFCGYLELLVHALRNANSLRLRPVRAVFNRQVHATVMAAFKTSAWFALLCGVSVAIPIAVLTENDRQLLVDIFVRELGPLVTAIVIAARRSGTMASELASMRIGGEIQSLEFMGIPYNSYLLVPRIIGVALSVTVLNVYFQAIAISAGLFATSLFLHISFGEHPINFLELLAPLDLLLSLLKGFLYGVVVSAYACYHGMNAAQAISEIPAAARRAVTHGILAVFLLDAVIARIAFMLS